MKSRLGLSSTGVELAVRQRQVWVLSTARSRPTAVATRTGDQRARYEAKRTFEERRREESRNAKTDARCGR